VKAIIMGSAISIEDTAKKVDDGCPHVASTPFPIDFQAVYDLGCQF
jgi:hypothetical protein